MQFEKQHNQVVLLQPKLFIPILLICMSLHHVNKIFEVEDGKHHLITNHQSILLTNAIPSTDDDNGHQGTQYILTSVNRCVVIEHL